MSYYEFEEVYCFENVSSNTISELGWIIRHPDNEVPDVGYGIAAVLSLFMLLAAPWNLLVIIAILQKKLYTQPNVMLLLSLTVTNLLLSLLVMPFNIYIGIRGEYVFGSSDQQRCAVCQTGLILIILPLTSLHTLALISVDRFIYLKRPMKYDTTVTKWRVLVAIAIVWVICTVIALPPLFGFGEINFSYEVATCVPIFTGQTQISQNHNYIFLLLSVSFIPLIILFVMYVWIVCIIRSSLVRKLKRSMTITIMNTESSVIAVTKVHGKGQLRMAWLFSAIFTANIITWLPMVGLAISSAVLDAAPTLVSTMVYLVYLSETVIHPVLMVCLIRDIKEAITGYFRHGHGHRKGSKTRKEDTSCTNGDSRFSSSYKESSTFKSS